MSSVAEQDKSSDPSENIIFPAHLEQLKRYFQLANRNEAWVVNLPPEQAWMLAFRESDAWQALAEKQGIEYRPNRVEEPPTKGQELLELAQRRHTAVDAIETGILKWGSGQRFIAEVDSRSPEAILGALQGATARLTDVLTDYYPVRIKQLNTKGEVTRELTSVDVLRELADHEERHQDLGRILFDGAKALFPPTYQFTMPQTPLK